MIRCCDYKAGSTVGVEHLKHGVYHSLDLAMLGRVISGTSERVELIEEQNPPSSRCEFENAAKVGRSLSQVGGHNGVEAHDCKRRHELGCDRLCDRGLAAAGRSVQQYALATRKARGVEFVPTPDLLTEVLQLGVKGMGNDQVIETPRRLSDVGERPTSVAITGRLGKREGKSSGGTRLRTDDLAKISRERQMLLGFLVLNDRLCRPSERQLVALVERPKELLEITAGHSLRLSPVPATEQSGCWRL